jgi:heat shock protein HslJ
MKKPAALPATAVLAILFLMAGCTFYNPVPDEANLVGTAWVTEELEGYSVPRRSEPTAEFESERITGSAGCNRYAAPLSISGKRIRTGKADTTRETCDPEVIGQELRFLAALAAVFTYSAEPETSPETLRLIDEQGVTRIRFARIFISPRTYLCSDGAHAISVFMRPAGRDAIEVQLPDAARRLERVPIPAGVRYTDGRVAVSSSSSGSETMLEVANHRYDCSER